MVTHNRQLIAGAVSDVVLNSIREGYGHEEHRGALELLNGLSYFDTDVPVPRRRLSRDSTVGSLLCVLVNLLQRGCPTRTSLFVEAHLRETWGGIEFREDGTGAVGYFHESTEVEELDALWSSLFITDPRVGAERVESPYWKSTCDSELELTFVRDFLNLRQSPGWLQLLEPQRCLESLLRYAVRVGEDRKSGTLAPEEFIKQRLDFSIELPPVFRPDREAMVVEVDGPHHLQDATRVHDRRRDGVLRAVTDTRWSIVRVSPAQWWKLAEDLTKAGQGFFDDRYFQKVIDNYQRPLYLRPHGLRALAIGLTPVAVARLQRVVVELLLSGELRLDGSPWCIGVVERDVGCAQIAFDDLFLTLGRLYALSGLEWERPALDLSVYGTPEFRAPGSAALPPIGAAASFAGDILIDISVLQRSGLSDAIQSRARRAVMIRSSHSRSAIRRFESAKPLDYLSLGVGEDSVPHAGRTAAIDGFVRDIFRKRGLRDGQLEIIDLALQRRSVIGLLPTGGGKSMTYQLCALLQPGVTLVVDPIKALMKDQDTGLRKNLIDATVFVNSNIKGHTEKTWAQSQLAEGRVLFCFISPERLVVPAFRSSLESMHHLGKVAFAYCIVDEAHCVSEWGHDFRSVYLRLGANAR